MAVTYTLVATIWIIVLGLFAFSGSGIGTRVALVVSSGLAAAIVLLVARTLRKSAALTGAHILALADADDVMRMDSDKG